MCAKHKYELEKNFLTSSTNGLFAGWMIDPDMRPGFTDLKLFFQNILDEDVYKYSTDYNDVILSCYPSFMLSLLLNLKR